MSPRWTRSVGPGTVPPNVQAWTTYPLATVMSFSMIGKSTSWTVPGGSAGAFGSATAYGGALGSGASVASGAAAGALEPAAGAMPGMAALA